jgi:branched-chain amino acid transport system ATP-binding protein
MPATSLEVENLSAGYGPTRVLEGVSFSVPAGARLAVLGRNGMGKTTLLATLAGQTKRYDGRISLGASDVTAMPSASRAHHGLGYVPQARCIFPTLTVEENLFVGLKGRPKSALEEAYAMFPRLRERRRNLGNQLSGGEQQMLSTARTILGRPSVLLLDEPLEGLAPIIVEELLRSIARVVREEGLSAIIVEQNPRMILPITQHAVVIDRGAVVHQGDSAALLADPAQLDRWLAVSRS